MYEGTLNFFALILTGKLILMQAYMVGSNDAKWTASRHAAKLDIVFSKSRSVGGFYVDIRIRTLFRPHSMLTLLHSPPARSTHPRGIKFKRLTLIPLKQTIPALGSEPRTVTSSAYASCHLATALSINKTPQADLKPQYKLLMETIVILKRSFTEFHAKMRQGAP